MKRAKVPVVSKKNIGSVSEAESSHIKWKKDVVMLLNMFRKNVVRAAEGALSYL